MVAELGGSMFLLFAAIMEVEGWRGPGTRGAYGEIGPYQITEAYWKDANMPVGRFEDCEDAQYSRKVMRRYWNRYCPDALRAQDHKTLAAVHHFGHTGAKMTTYRDDYVQRVLSRLEAMR